MAAMTTFNKALFVLDQSDHVRGEALLREALAQAQGEKNSYVAGQAMCCLGDLLYQLGRSTESEGFLEAVMALNTHDDVLDVERDRARELLAAIKRDRES